MPELELKYPCPVCLGATMTKATIGAQRTFTLDHCPRCGGIWFEHGEVGRLRHCRPEDLWRQVAPMDGVHAMQCHSCTTPLERGAERCKACGWRVELDCPACSRPMESSIHEGVHLDLCRHCKGVWFDRHELADIWRMQFGAALRRREGRHAGHASLVLLDALAYDPILAYYGVSAAGHILSAGANAAASTAPAVVEAAGEAAASLFETIVELIAGIFG